MTQNMLNEIMKSSLVLVLKVAGPFLLTALVLGLIISIFQAVTSIQEQTLTFVPKFLAVCALGLFLGSWIVQTFVNYTEQIFDLIIKVST